MNKNQLKLRNGNRMAGKGIEDITSALASEFKGKRNITRDEVYAFIIGALEGDAVYDAACTAYAEGLKCGKVKRGEAQKGLNDLNTWNKSTVSRAITNAYGEEGKQQQSKKEKHILDLVWGSIQSNVKARRKNGKLSTAEKKKLIRWIDTEL